MKLCSIAYEHSGSKNANPWILANLVFGDRNLIVARNATGKSRIIGATINLARFIQSPILPSINGTPQKNLIHGKWQVSFIDDKGQDFVYWLDVNKGTVVSEHITVNGKKLLVREGSHAKIYSHNANDFQTIDPPSDRLVLHVRRDQTEFPFLEELSLWAGGTKGFSFANTSPHLIEIPGNPLQLTSLNAVPSILKELTPDQQCKVFKQLHELGYEIEGATTGLEEGAPSFAEIIFVKEKGLEIALRQLEISQGMFRAFSLLVILEFLRSSGKIGCVLIDDLGEGLDFDRARKLAEFVFSQQGQHGLQIIATSNDAFLLNSVPLNSLTVCYRKGHIVSGWNSINSPEKFEEWRTFGLNNLELLSSNFLLD